MNASDIVAVRGPVDESIIADILMTGATSEELAQAWARRQVDEGLINEGRQHPSARVAELVALLEELDDDGEE